jgi:energy-coupling factor transport system ATP-binding protein
VSIWRRWLDAGRGLLLVTHDVELVAQIADRVVILEEGRAVDAGETAVVLRRHPRFTPQVARLFPHTEWLTPEQTING